MYFSLELFVKYRVLISKWILGLHKEIWDQDVREADLLIRMMSLTWLSVHGTFSRSDTTQECRSSRLILSDDSI